ncbi:mevalonate kinase family protein [Dyadobacter sandarakinus]|uniref:GHMP kinase n=1 Tax=Dyadobacter sandarakinus TaxID=2747268 RepID=A0ABX7I2E1_9BACT|nr:galactokinase family protein [Dyadobacter sandarakinus]QRQ99998.1 GHMP kinase [Dyadobacter sandarakinus]
MKISTPGRICLFGEHQDYLGLPVIAAAISRRISVEGDYRSDNRVILRLPDLGAQLELDITNTFPYVTQRDYFRSTINVLKRRGITFSKGFDCTIQGNIPINSGTSSSSALIVSWANFLDRMSDKPAYFSDKELGEIANAAEVLEFGEPGGMMDNYSTAIGNVIYLESTPEIHVEALTPTLGTFVLGDSLEPKDTLGILARCRYGMEAVIARVKAHDSAFSIFTTPLEKIAEYRSYLSEDDHSLLKANIEDRDILVAGKDLLLKNAVHASEGDFHSEFGALLYRHHENLRDHKRTSTPKIERMMDAALAAGALGGKINGSGGGGCMFAYAPENAGAVAAAIERAGGKSYMITVDSGTRVE